MCAIGTRLILSDAGLWPPVKLEVTCSRPPGAAAECQRYAQHDEIRSRQSRQSRHPQFGCRHAHTTRRTVQGMDGLDRTAQRLVPHHYPVLVQLCRACDALSVRSSSACRRAQPGLNVGQQMTATRDDVVSRALALFGETRAAEALALVDAYGAESHEHEVHRVKLAILEVSEGKMSRLPYFVKCAKIDCRDVLTGTKLGPMTDEEEARWQASADRILVQWNRK